MLLGTPASGSTGIACFAGHPHLVPRNVFAGRLEGNAKTHSESGHSLGSAAPGDGTSTTGRRHLTTARSIPISAAVGQNYLGELVFATSGNRGLYNTNFKNFAPRIGFAYQLMPKLVMRGGYGIFYPPSFRGTGPAIPGFSFRYALCCLDRRRSCAGCTLSTAFSGGLVPSRGNSFGRLDQCRFRHRAVSRNRKTYYDQQWMYGFQYAPTTNDVIDLTYVGNHGVHVTASGLNLNQLDPKYFSMGNALLNQVTNPFFGHITSSGCGLDQAPRFRKANCSGRIRNSAILTRTQ